MKGGSVGTKATRLSAALLAGSALLCTVAAPAWADDLRSALVAAYNTNPTLEGARAEQRANDENVPIQRAAGRPSLSAQGQYTENIKNADGALTAAARSVSASASLSVPIYSGGAVRNSIAAAKIRVEAGQANLRGTESSVFSQVVGAYMDVIQNEAIVGLNRSNVEVLEVNLQATSDRFEIGDLTRTDVAQSRSRLELARGQARAAEANLIEARERYIRLVGRPPGDLEAPPPLPNLPATPIDAVNVALESNPDLIAAQERRKASSYDIEVAGAGRLPRVEIFSSGSYSNNLNSQGVIPGLPAGFAQANTNTTAQVGARLSIPLYQGGRPAAQERQAQARSSQAIEQEIEIERSVIAQTRSAYSAWQASNEIITSSQSAVDAATLSLEGVRAENSVGNRTILDILNAEQELLSAQVELVRARRNAYVAGFSLLAAMGKAEAQDLGLDGGPLYDPEINYKRVRGKWFDWEFDPDPVARSTRTVDTLPQNGSISASDTAKAGNVTGVRQ